MFYDGNVSAERKEEKKQSKYAIDVENLRVRYETSSEVVMAVNGIDLQLKRGEIGRASCRERVSS